MFDALYVGATGMQAQQQAVDTIANNLANVNTVGFKKSRVGFADLMVSTVMGTAGADPGAAPGALPTSRLGVGVAISSLAKVFEGGELKKTDSELDLAIQGEGFIEVLLADGMSAFTRGGTLKVNGEGLLATQDGKVLKARIAVPDSAQALLISRDGQVQARLPGQAKPVELGQIDLTRFASSGTLEALGANLYRASESSGAPIAQRPGEDGVGTLVQGHLESSNVKMVDELVNLMLAQRAYEASVKVVQAADEMMGMVNNLRK
jgi:flagellar basal-body rod protein FlgG